MMRGTLRIVSARDFLGLRSALQHALNDALRAIGSRGKGLVLDEVIPVARALLDERPRDLDELRCQLSADFPNMTDRALGYATRMRFRSRWCPRTIGGPFLGRRCSRPRRLG